MAPPQHIVVRSKTYADLRKVEPFKKSQVLSTVADDEIRRARQSSKPVSFEDLQEEVPVRDLDVKHSPLLERLPDLAVDRKKVLVPKISSESHRERHVEFSRVPVTEFRDRPRLESCVGDAER